MTKERGYREEFRDERSTYIHTHTQTDKRTYVLTIRYGCDVVFMSSRSSSRNNLSLPADPLSLFKCCVCCFGRVTHPISSTARNHKGVYINNNVVNIKSNIKVEIKIKIRIKIGRVKTRKQESKHVSV